MKELELIYRKRKKQLLPLIFGFASFFVFFRIVMPQWSDIQDVQSLLTSKSTTVDAKEQSVTLLNSLPQSVVDENYEVITTALPLQKDVVLIYAELNKAAEKSGVKLGGFSIKVGGIYAAESEKKTQPTTKAVNGIPFLNILVNAEGENTNLRKFAQELYKSIPLVDIKAIDLAKSDARLDVNFYYKPVTVRPLNADTTAVKNLTKAEESQLNTLKGWR